MTKRLVLASLLLMAVSAAVRAQDDVRALGAAVDTIVRRDGVTHGHIVNRIVSEIFEKNNRNAALGTRIAKSYYNYNEDQGDVYNAAVTHKRRYFHMDDSVTAMKYIRMALQTDSSYSKAYVLAADMFDYDGRTDLAMAWLDKGLKNNPKDSLLYIAEAEILARTDVEAAKEKLSALKQLDPNFLMDRYMARIYEKLDVTGVAYRHQVAEYLGNMDFKVMTRDEIELYVYSLYFSGQTETCNAKAFDALKKYPRSLALNQFYFRTLVQMKKNAEAIDAFHNLANAEPIPGKPVLELNDSISYAAALGGTKKYDEALSLFDVILAKPHLTSNDKRNVDIYLSQTMRARVKEFTDKSDYQNAADFYSAFVEKRKAAGTINDDIYVTYAKIYTDWSTELNGAEKEAVLLKADAIYADAIPQSKDNADAFVYQRFTIHSVLDPTRDQGLAMPDANQLIDMLAGLPSLDRGQKARLLNVYQYMVQYNFFNKKDKKTALAYADKMLDVDPTNEVALKFISALSGK